MKITLRHHDGTPDEAYDFKPGKMQLSELYVLKARTGLKLGQWMDGLSEMDPDALHHLLGLLRNRAGVTDAFDGIDFAIDDFDVDLDDDPGAALDTLAAELASLAEHGEWAPEEVAALTAAQRVLATRARRVRRDPTEPEPTAITNGSETNTLPTSLTSST